MWIRKARPVFRARRLPGRAFALCAAFVTAWLLAGGSARAVLIVGLTDANGKPMGGQNTSAPSGTLAGSGWQFEGLWAGSFTGTAIAPNYFITSSHVGALGDTFVFDGQTFTTTAQFVSPTSPDLAIYRVNGTFANYAPIYTGGDEVGKPMAVFGRGGGPAGSTTTDGVALNGWLWSSGTTALTWGTSVVTFAGQVQNGVPGEYLIWQFDKNLGPNTGGITSGDSGGGVFVLNNGVWQLAGVNFAADSPYNTQPGNPRDTRFLATLYDARGLYYNSDSPIAGAQAVPSESAASRLSNESAWISGVIGTPAIPEPASVVLMAGGLALAVPLVRGRTGRTPN